MMFARGDLKSETIDGAPYVTFQPNTIVYAVPENNTLARQIKGAQMGIVWHTQYTGSKMSEMKASFGVNVGQFRLSKNVWFRDASFTDLSGTASFTIDETNRITEMLSRAGILFRAISPRLLNEIATNTTYRTIIKTYNNSRVRAGEKITDTGMHTNGLIKSLADKATVGIQDAKKPENKLKRSSERERMLHWFRVNARQLKLIFDLQNLLVDAKNIIIRKLETMEQATHMFIRDADGLKVTNPEGFVCTDHIGNTIKLVDRLSFSHNNFNAAKNWQK
jgi:hypothetical protein